MDILKIAAEIVESTGIDLPEAPSYKGLRKILDEDGNEADLEKNVKCLVWVGGAIVPSQHVEVQSALNEPNQALVYCEFVEDFDVVKARWVACSTAKNPERISVRIEANHNSSGRKTVFTGFLLHVHDGDQALHCVSTDEGEE